jgi:hypothetical protein
MLRAKCYAESMALSLRRSALSGRRVFGLAAPFFGVMLLALMLAGCANPGPPHAPSLFLPAPVAITKIAASRIGNSVDIRFTVPSRSTDNLPLRSQQLNGSLCRQPEMGPCLPVTSLPAKMSVAAKGPDGLPNIVTWQDTLPADLAGGPPRAIAYRMEFFNAAGVSGGKSDPVIATAGQAPPSVEGLTAEGSRAGIVLRWKPAPASAGEVLIRREDISASAKTPASRNHPEPGVAWLTADADSSGKVLDDTALPDVAYRYTAQRRVKVQVAGRELEMRSDESAPVNFTLREIYAPSAPTGLTAVGFANADSQFAVDLIWQPVNEHAVTGYNIYRQPIDSNGGNLAPRARINSAKISLPGFHDETASAATRYRYEVTAIDAHGNESPPDSTLLEPAPR